MRSKASGIAQLHELVGVAGVAVAAAELAAAVGVDAVGEAQAAVRGGAIEDAADFERLELDEVAVVGVLGLGGHAGDADGLRGRMGKSAGGVGRWVHVFAFYSPIKKKLTLPDSVVSRFCGKEISDAAGWANAFVYGVGRRRGLVVFEPCLGHAALGFGILHEGLPDEGGARIFRHEHGDAGVDADDVGVVPVLQRIEGIDEAVAAPGFAGTCS